MANAVTSLGNRTIKCLGRGAVAKKKVVIDTTGSDVEVMAAVADEAHNLVGGSSSKASAATTLTFTDGTDVIGSILIASGACLALNIEDKVHSGIMGRKNKALKVQSDVAITLYLDFVTAPIVEIGMSK